MSDFDDKTPTHLRDRVRLELMEARLKDGAETFADLRESIKELRPKPWRAIASAVGICLTLLGVAYAAGKVVAQAEDTRESSNETRMELNAVKSDVRDLKTTVDKIETAVGDIQRQAKQAPAAPARDPLGRRRRR